MNAKKQSPLIQDNVIPVFLRLCFILVFELREFWFACVPLFYLKESNSFISRGFKALDIDKCSLQSDLSPIVLCWSFCVYI
uniref:Uncharacterized protein n=1 Tax=Rhizophora mucronata TaxID=61149 RepID=A0A2P2P0J6_RHIMU